MKNTILKKASSKKGITLVEVICAVCVLVIFTVGLITLLYTTHNSILKTSFADTKAARVEGVVDSLVTYTTNSQSTDFESMVDTLFSEDTVTYVADGKFDKNDIKTVQFTAATCENNTLVNTQAVTFTATLYYTVAGKTEHITYSSIAYLNGLDWGVNNADT